MVDDAQSGKLSLHANSSSRVYQKDPTIGCTINVCIAQQLMLELKGVPYGLHDERKNTKTGDITWLGCAPPHLLAQLAMLTN
eukprot:1159891-Pelagomonas_calceolata.AAC.8